METYFLASVEQLCGRLGSGSVGPAGKDSPSSGSADGPSDAVRGSPLAGPPAPSGSPAGPSQPHPGGAGRSPAGAAGPVQPAGPLPARSAPSSPQRPVPARGAPSRCPVQGGVQPPGPWPWPQQRAEDDRVSSASPLSSRWGRLTQVPSPLLCRGGAFSSVSLAPGQSRDPAPSGRGLRPGAVCPSRVPWPPRPATPERSAGQLLG